MPIRSPSRNAVIAERIDAVQSLDNIQISIDVDDWIRKGDKPGIGTDGVSVNRDASLLFEDAPLSEYFRAIFEHDWAYQATQNIGAERGGVRVASRDESTPAGMVRLSWKDYMEMQ